MNKISLIIVGVIIILVTFLVGAIIGINFGKNPEFAAGLIASLLLVSSSSMMLVVRAWEYTQIKEIVAESIGKMDFGHIAVSVPVFNWDMEAEFKRREDMEGYDDGPSNVVKSTSAGEEHTLPFDL